jgi:hypothetical protein
MGVNSTVTYLIYCKNFYKCHNVSPPNTTIKNKENLINVAENVGKKLRVKQMNIKSNIFTI